MNRITSILAPVDFSEASKAAMNCAARLALQLEARLVVAHIVPPLATFSNALRGDGYGYERQVFTEAESRLPDEVPVSYRNRLNTLPIVRCGNVQDELLSIVHSEKIDLVVMGTHGRHVPGRMFLGSTVENMLRKVPVPILTVSRHLEELPQLLTDMPFRKVVYATDLSETAEAGFRYCVDLARALGAEMTLLHVLDVKNSVAFENSPEIRARMETRLRKLIEGENCIGLPVRTEVGEGIPYRRILKFAEESSADLIVINLQSNVLLERALLGSTAERVIRSSRIPVLSIPSATAGHALRSSNVDIEAHVDTSEVKIA